MHIIITAQSVAILLEIMNLNGKDFCIATVVDKQLIGKKVEQVMINREQLLEDLMKCERLGRKSLEAVLEIINKQEIEYIPLEQRAFGRDADGRCRLRGCNLCDSYRKQLKADKWIPCSVVEHPEHNHSCEVTIKDTVGYKREIGFYADRWRRESDEVPLDVIAWKEPSQPYKKEGAE